MSISHHCNSLSGSYWLAKIVQVEENSDNVEIIYFDENVFKIESAVSSTVSKGSILCSFGTIHHNTKQFKLSDEFQAKLIQQVAEARHLLRKELLYYMISIMVTSSFSKR